MPVASVIEALNGEGPISKDWVLAWMDEPDIRTRGAVYELTRRAWPRITPELSMQEQCSFMADYLIECLLTDPDESEWGHSAFLAGYEIAAWLKHLHGIPGTSLIIGAVAQELTHGYRQADTSTRNGIETFCLEHIFENRSLRAFFAQWREDPELNGAYELCAEWGDAHSD